jgi:hypothetical protein
MIAIATQPTLSSSDHSTELRRAVIASTIGTAIYQPCKHRRFRQEGIDAVGLHAFKVVATLEIASQMWLQRSSDFGNDVLRQNTFKDQVAATVETLPARPRTIGLQARGAACSSVVVAIWRSPYRVAADLGVGLAS